MRDDISLTVIQSRDHILNTFDSEISDYAENRFKRKNINVVTNARVIRIEKDKVIYQPKTYGGEEANEPAEKEMDAGICLWSTGIGKWCNRA
jgi:NADH dehydrogenase